MTQTLNALHTNLSGAKESSVKEASMMKQDGRQDTGIRHVGLHVTGGGALQGRSWHGDHRREHA